MDKKKQARKIRNKLDKDWAIAVKAKYHNMCAFCESTNRINAHHIIPREFKETRHNIDNGIALCPLHHKWGMFSAHKNPLWFISKLAEEDIDRLNKVFEVVKELYAFSEYKK